MSDETDPSGDRPADAPAQTMDQPVRANVRRRRRSSVSGRPGASVVTIGRATFVSGIVAVAAVCLAAFGMGFWAGTIVPRVPRDESVAAADPETRTGLSTRASTVAPVVRVATEPSHRQAQLRDDPSSLPAQAREPPAVSPPPPSPALRTDPPPGRFGVQLGAFKTADEAAAFVAGHASAFDGLPVFVVTVRIRGRGTWHRVRVGAEQTRAAAAQLRDRLGRSMGGGGLIVGYR